MWNVQDFGAVGDRQTHDRAAIQAAIDACAQAGGGTVLLPSGDYLSGALRLHSDVTLYARQPAYVTVAHVREPTVNGLRVYLSDEAFQAYPRAAFSGHELQDALLRDIHRQPAGDPGRIPAVILDHCRNTRRTE